MKTLLSYPRSGSHLCRFFIELLTEEPTISKFSKRDTPIYKNRFDKEIPFNINDNFNEANCYHFYHSLKNCKNKIDNSYNMIDNKLIIIVRNPREVLIRHCGKSRIKYKLWDGYDEYFNIIDQFKDFKGKKLLLFYEDMLTDKVKFITQLSHFLQVNNNKKIQYVLNNLEDLYNLSLNGKKRYWGGNKSNSELKHYYKDIDPKIKKEFDEYVNRKLMGYPYIRNKYRV